LRAGPTLAATIMTAAALIALPVTAPAQAGQGAPSTQASQRTASAQAGQGRAAHGAVTTDFRDFPAGQDVSAELHSYSLSRCLTFEFDVISVRFRESAAIKNHWRASCPLPPTAAVFVVVFATVRPPEADPHILGVAQFSLARPGRHGEPISCLSAVGLVCAPHHTAPVISLFFSRRPTALGPPCAAGPGGTLCVLLGNKRNCACRAGKV
jgi:hypothetical protein